MVNRVELITQAEYARRRGCAKSAVAKAVKEGRITLIGKLIDPKVADIQWQENTRARADSAPAGRDGAAGQVQAPLVAGQDAAGDGQHQVGAEPEDYSVYRRRREKAEAEMAEQNAAKAAGRLVDRDSADRAAFDAFRELRDRCFAETRSAARLVIGMTEVREVEQALEDAMRKAFGDFETSMRRRLAAMAA
jgi:hypothetical protein